MSGHPHSNSLRCTHGIPIKPRQPPMWAGPGSAPLTCPSHQDKSSTQGLESEKPRAQAVKGDHLPSHPIPFPICPLGRTWASGEERGIRSPYCLSWNDLRGEGGKHVGPHEVGDVPAHSCTCLASPPAGLLPLREVPAPTPCEPPEGGTVLSTERGPGT